MNKDASQLKQAKPHQQALDLVLMVHPRELDKATVRSLMAESLAACDGKELAALDEPLEALRKSHPDDLSIAIAIALRALAGDDAKRTESAFEGLIALVEKAPLEPLPSGTRANSRQRAEAVPLIPLWVVARACWKQPSRAMHTIGDRLADRAREAARRQNDNRWLLAMLREQGQLALDHNDRAAADATWLRMLNMVVAPEPAKSQRPRPNRPAPTPTRGAPVTKPAAAPAKTTTPASRSRTGLLKRRSFSALTFIAMACVVSPPCEGGVRGGGQGITSNFDRSGGHRSSAGGHLAEASRPGTAYQAMVPPGPPPLPPPSQGGEMDRSFAPGATGRTRPVVLATRVNGDTGLGCTVPALRPSSNLRAYQPPATKRRVARSRG